MCDEAVKREDAVDYDSDHEPRDAGDPTRRDIWRVAAGGFALAASGLFLPDAMEETEARKHRKGRSRSRTQRRRERKRLRQSTGPFRNAALSVLNKSAAPLTCTWYYREHSSGDSYGNPVFAKNQVIAMQEEGRFDPGYLRVGLLIWNIDPGLDLYVDVRNVGLWYPRGGVFRGAQLDPPTGKFGDAFIAEQNFSQKESRKRARVELKRREDSTTAIEWELVIGEGR